jgi:hypothetical protein
MRSAVSVLTIDHHNPHFCSYMVKEFSDIFLSEYETPSADYIKHAS